MNREATEKLRLDRRLINRPGWISKAELEKNLEALPDVSDKIAPVEEEEEPSKAAPAEETVSKTAGGQGAAPEAVPPRVE
jgi:hypothetical protein